ncbi:unnamed protein product [Amoebophrya sp. A120]|nr:unnamed protein product [Amoebophrya sp. A120]|eukprot:GSA120T00013383001.1
MTGFGGGTTSAKPRTRASSHGTLDSDTNFFDVSSVSEGEQEVNNPAQNLGNEQPPTSSSSSTKKPRRRSGSANNTTWRGKFASRKSSIVNGAKRKMRASTSSSSTLVQAVPRPSERDLVIAIDEILEHEILQAEQGDDGADVVRVTAFATRSTPPSKILNPNAFIRADGEGETSAGILPEELVLMGGDDDENEASDVVNNIARQEPMKMMLHRDDDEHNVNTTSSTDAMPVPHHNSTVHTSHNVKALDDLLSLLSTGVKRAGRRDDKQLVSTSAGRGGPTNSNGKRSHHYATPIQRKSSSRLVIHHSPGGVRGRGRTTTTSSTALSSSTSFGAGDYNSSKMKDKFRKVLPPRPPSRGAGDDITTAMTSNMSSPVPHHSRSAAATAWMLNAKQDRKTRRLSKGLQPPTTSEEVEDDPENTKQMKAEPQVVVDPDRDYLAICNCKREGLRLHNWREGVIHVVRKEMENFLPNLPGEEQNEQREGGPLLTSSASGINAEAVENGAKQDAQWRATSTPVLEVEQHLTPARQVHPAPATTSPESTSVVAKQVPQRGSTAARFSDVWEPVKVRLLLRDLLMRKRMERINERERSLEKEQKQLLLLAEHEKEQLSLHELGTPRTAGEHDGHDALVTPSQLFCRRESRFDKLSKRHVPTTPNVVQQTTSAVDPSFSISHPSVQHIKRNASKKPAKNTAIATSSTAPGGRSSSTHAATKKMNLKTLPLDNGRRNKPQLPINNAKNPPSTVNIPERYKTNVVSAASLLKSLKTTTTHHDASATVATSAAKPSKVASTSKVAGHKPPRAAHNSPANKVKAVELLQPEVDPGSDPDFYHQGSSSSNNYPTGPSKAASPGWPESEEREEHALGNSTTSSAAKIKSGELQKQPQQQVREIIIAHKQFMESMMKSLPDAQMKVEHSGMKNNNNNDQQLLLRHSSTPSVDLSIRDQLNDLRSLLDKCAALVEREFPHFLLDGEEVDGANMFVSGARAPGSRSVVVPDYMDLHQSHLLHELDFLFHPVEDYLYSGRIIHPVSDADLAMGSTRTSSMTSPYTTEHANSTATALLPFKYRLKKQMLLPLLRLEEKIRHSPSYMLECELGRAKNSYDEEDHDPAADLQRLITFEFLKRLKIYNVPFHQVINSLRQAVLLFPCDSEIFNACLYNVRVNEAWRGRLLAGMDLREEVERYFQNEVVPMNPRRTSRENLSHVAQQQELSGGSVVMDLELDQDEENITAKNDILLEKVVFHPSSSTVVSYEPNVHLLRDVLRVVPGATTTTGITTSTGSSIKTKTADLVDDTTPIVPGSGLKRGHQNKNAAQMNHRGSSPGFKLDFSKLVPSSSSQVVMQESSGALLEEAAQTPTQGAGGRATSTTSKNEAKPGVSAHLLAKYPLKKTTASIGVKNKQADTRTAGKTGTGQALDRMRSRGNIKTPAGGGSQHRRGAPGPAGVGASPENKRQNVTGPPHYHLHPHKRQQQHHQHQPPGVGFDNILPHHATTGANAAPGTIVSETINLPTSSSQQDTSSSSSSSSPYKPELTILVGGSASCPSVRALLPDFLANLLPRANGADFHNGDHFHRNGDASKTNFDLLNPRVSLQFVYIDEAHAADTLASNIGGSAGVANASHKSQADRRKRALDFWKKEVLAHFDKEDKDERTRSCADGTSTIKTTSAHLPAWLGPLLIDLHPENQFKEFFACWPTRVLVVNNYTGKLEFVSFGKKKDGGRLDLDGVYDVVLKRGEEKTKTTSGGRSSSSSKQGKHEQPRKKTRSSHPHADDVESHHFPRHDDDAKEHHQKLSRRSKTW